VIRTGRVAALFSLLAALTSGARAASGPRRIVALAPNLTEIVFALGAGNRLVGVSEHSDFPPAAASISVVGGLTPDLEKIVSLRPDLVLATTEGNSPATVALLARQGVPVLTTSAPDLEGVIVSIRTIGSRLGLMRAAQSLAASLEARRRTVLRRPHAAAPSAILLIWPSPPQAAGPRTFADDLLRTAGSRNCIGRPGWPVLSPEFLVQTDCSVIVYPMEKDTRETFARAFHDGPLSAMKAVRAGRIVGIDGDRLTRPGPRAFDALEDLAAALDGLR
jgi:iron complex transport system substrate-binding protein